MTPGFLEFIAQAARLVQSGHADDAEAMVWTTLEESALPVDEDAGSDAGAEAAAERQRGADRSDAAGDSR
jgi:hypothetical protein